MIITLVNCNDASHLISFVQNNIKDKSVYIATNEKNAQDELKLLTDAGFLIFNQSYVSNITNDDLNIFMLEVGLMLDSTTFLGWGVSEINDVVENQRMRMKKSYCKTNENLLEEIVFPTWCANMNRTIYSSNFNDGPISGSHSHTKTIHNTQNTQNTNINHHYDKNNGGVGNLRQVLQNITTARIKDHNHHHQQQQQQNKND